MTNNIDEALLFKSIFIDKKDFLYITRHFDIHVNELEEFILDILDTNDDYPKSIISDVVGPFLVDLRMTIYFYNKELRKAHNNDDRLEYSEL